ncbi:RNA polymerase sigma factor [Cellulomonas hominis]
MDERQFATMFAELYPVVLGYAARRTDWHVAEDVASQALTIAWRRGDALPETLEERRAWLIVVARNLLANAQRSRLRADGLDRRLRAGLAAGIPVAEHDPADIVADRELASGAMRRLSPRDQEILQLVAWEGLELTELAQVLGCTPATASMRVHRARRRLDLLVRAAHAEEGAGQLGATAQTRPAPSSGGAVTRAGAVEPGSSSRGVR